MDPVAPAAPAAAPVTEPASGTTDTTEPKAAPEPEKAAPKAAPKEPEPRRKHKVKIDNEELEVDEDELKSGYQKAKSSQKAYQAAAEQRKQIEALFRKIKDNPVKGLQELLRHPSINADMRKVATEYLAGELDKEAMSPEQREHAEMKRELEEMKAEREAAQRELEESEASEVRKKYASQIETEILAAIKPSGMPVTEFTFKRVTYYLREGLKRGMNLKAEDVVPLVKQDYWAEVKQLTGGLDADALEDLLGGEVTTKLRTRAVEKFKQTPAVPEPPVTDEDADEEEDEPVKPKRVRKPKDEKLTYAELAQKMRGRKW